MAGALTQLPDVEIDPEGTFKYILVTVKVKDGTEQKDIVRGTKSAEYHSKFIVCLNCFQLSPSGLSKQTWLSNSCVQQKRSYIDA